MNRKRGGVPAHRRNPTLDCSPLRKSVAAFAAEEALVDSQQPVWGPPSGSAAGSLRGSGDSSSLRGSGDSGDRIPAHRGAAASATSDATGPAAAPQGSAWNPWQEHGVPPSPLPPRRVVAHRPSPSWFSPVLGFGGPASCVWQEEEQRRSQERQQAQQAGRSQQQQHAQPPPPQQQQQDAQPAPPQQQQQQAAQENERQPSAVQRSIPWYQQGWQQQPRQPQQPDSLQYPGSNPFASEPCGPTTAGPSAASGLPCSQQRQVGIGQLGGCSSGRKLPPPPRFLLARKAQQPQHAEQPQQMPQHMAMPAPAPVPSHQPGGIGQPSPVVAGPAHAAQDVQPRVGEPLDASCGGQQAVCSEQQQQQPGAPQAPPPPPPMPSAGPARVTALAPPPPPPPPPPGRPAAQPAGAAPPPPPPPPPAGPAARPAGAPPPPPPPPKKAAGSLPSQPPSHSAGQLPASAVPAPAPQAAPTAAAAAPEPTARLPAPAAPAAGGSALSAIRADELLAAAGRLRKVQAGAVEGSEGSSGRAAGSSAAAGGAAQDPRAAMLDQIKQGVKLRPMEARKLPPPAAPAAGPLGQATPSMAELLRKVVEARRVDAGGDSDSDSEWGA